MGTKPALITARDTCYNALYALQPKIGGNVQVLQAWYGAVMLANAVISRVPDWIELAPANPTYDPVIAALNGATAALNSSTNAPTRLAAIARARSAFIGVNGILDADD
ncbi:hypothetical protein P1X14_16955 [Sphingomonas sp. AOB5]|uniref:hypothetical protein n=1 Tax=Sphingomonas sp. AOB5 TaxID=3034017 RepID=UPI0023F6F6CC|nr:hypothetical protein [Sphingomonas sp. AOB5]MDF7776949.1 hypothetical protein [Sphingomonas sp. AOB5]